jgi:hypothetical protein
MTTTTDLIGAIGLIVTAIAVVIAVKQYIHVQRASKLQRDHELAAQLKIDLRQVAQLTESLKDILIQGNPLIRGSASIAKEFRKRLGPGASPQMFLDKLANLPQLSF